MNQMTDRSCYPHIHFAAHFGWINDPNGLVCHDGIYEMYYQCNPDGVEWGNMTWGHARSTDLLHWEEKEPVLHPDENGAMYSGCGLRNERELLDLPREALLFFYTAAPSRAERKTGKEFTIRFACSTDGGDTLRKTGEPVLASAERENRDPKVFWHEGSQAYILLLWLKGNEFSIWRSEDLKHFSLSQRLVLDSGFECPDLFLLPVFDENGQPTGGSRWVFWEAAGNYYVGDFDGYTFTQTQPKKNACANPLPYAAQTWSGTPGGETLSLSWLRTACIRRQTTGVMALPRVLTLTGKEDDLKLRQSLPSGITSACGEKTQLPADTVLPVRDNALRILIEGDQQEPDPEGFLIDFFRDPGDPDPILTIEYRKEDKYLLFYTGEISRGQRYSFERTGSWDVVYDRGIVEISSCRDTFLYIDDFPQLRTSTCGGVRLRGDHIHGQIAEWV